MVMFHDVPQVMVEDTGFDSSPKDSIHGMISAQDAVTAGLRMEANAGEADFRWRRLGENFVTKMSWWRHW